MKILYLHQYFNTLEMNGSTRSLEVAANLVNSGNQVEIISLTRKNQSEFPKNYRGIKIIWIKIPYSNSLKLYQRILTFLSYTILCCFYVLFKKYDRVYATSTPLTVGIPALTAYYLRNKSFIFEVRDVWPEIPRSLGYLKNNFIFNSLKYLARKCYQKSHKIITLSVDMKSEILSNYLEIPTEKIIVAENGSKKEYFLDTDLDATLLDGLKLNDSRLVLYPGTFGEVNHVDYIIHLAKYFNQKVVFLLIGEGSQKQRIIELAKNNLTYNRNVFFLPAVSKKKVFQYIKRSDFIISTVASIPKLEQNSANKFFDGLRAGKCILINYGGWQADFIKKNKCGVCLSTEYEVAYKQLNEVIENPELLEEFQTNALKNSEQFELDSIADRIRQTILH